MSSTTDVIEAARAVLRGNDEGFLRPQRPEEMAALRDALQAYDASSVEALPRPFDGEPGVFSAMNDHYRKQMYPDTSRGKPVRGYDDTFSAVPVVMDMIELAGVTVIDRTGPVPVRRLLTDAELEMLMAPVEPTGGYNLADLDDDGNLIDEAVRNATWLVGDKDPG